MPSGTAASQHAAGECVNEALPVRQPSFAGAPLRPRWCVNETSPEVQSSFDGASSLLRPSIFVTLGVAMEQHPVALGAEMQRSPAAPVMRAYAALYQMDEDWRRKAQFVSRDGTIIGAGSNGEIISSRH